MKKRVSAWLYSIPVIFFLLSLLSGLALLHVDSSSYYEEEYDFTGSYEFELKNGKATVAFDTVGIYEIFRISNYPFGEDGQNWTPDNNFKITVAESKSKIIAETSSLYGMAFYYNGKTAYEIFSVYIEDAGEYVIDIANDGSAFSPAEGRFLVGTQTLRGGHSYGKDTFGFWDALFPFVVVFIFMGPIAVIVSLIVIIVLRVSRRNQNIPVPFYPAYGYPPQPAPYPPYEPTNVDQRNKNGEKNGN
jgi:hypothetical protein